MAGAVLMERVVLVSGGGRGLGAAITGRLLADGWSVSLGLRDVARAEQFGLADRVQAVRFDATDPACASDWVAAAAERFGRIDALVNNAGIMHMVDFDNGTEDDLD
ncbi:MAG: SDR family NAD(P)-dependent oxidoreductase, partial [Paracoccaceae bacterium]